MCKQDGGLSRQGGRETDSSGDASNFSLRTPNNESITSDISWFLSVAPSLETHPTIPPTILSSLLKEILK
jgi:hypothetical protein